MCRDRKERVEMGELDLYSQHISKIMYKIHLHLHLNLQLNQRQIGINELEVDGY